MSASTVSFAKNIRPLFREKDISAMKFSSNLDLSDFKEVSEKAAGILKRLEEGNMPCDGAWSADDIELFKSWMKDGKKP